MNMLYIPIGEFVEVEGQEYTAVPILNSFSSTDCKDCSLDPLAKLCERVACHAERRKDETDVVILNKETFLLKQLKGEL